MEMKRRPTCVNRGRFSVLIRLSLYAIYDLKACHLSCDNFSALMMKAYPTRTPHPVRRRPTADRCLADERCPAHRRPAFAIPTIPGNDKTRPSTDGDILSGRRDAADDIMNLEILAI